jgi:hypothetical protein
VSEFVADRRPGHLGAHTWSQAATFGQPSSFRLPSSGIATERYDMRPAADSPPNLGAIGRISPEKSLEDVAEVSARRGWPVKVSGVMQDADLWERIRREHPSAQLEYCGFLPPDDL